MALFELPNMISWGAGSKVNTINIPQSYILSSGSNLGISGLGVYKDV
jgi:hypothetical protein